MNLQTLDYLPVLSRIDEESTDSGGGRQALHIYGSELLKESLAQQDSASIQTTETKNVRVVQEKRESSYDHNNNIVVLLHIHMYMYISVIVLIY